MPDRVPVGRGRFPVTIGTEAVPFPEPAVGDTAGDPEAVGVLGADPEAEAGVGLARDPD